LYFFKVLAINTIKITFRKDIRYRYLRNEKVNSSKEIKNARILNKLTCLYTFYIIIM